MSPRGRDVPGEILSFPRVSGDEPALARVLPRATPFSPRERG